MRPPVLMLAGLLFCSVLAGAQESDCASVTQSKGEVVLTAEFWDPVYALSATLADRYGISVSVESPQWAFPGDAEDVAVADPQFSAQHDNVHYLVMKPHVVQILIRLEQRENAENSNRHAAWHSPYDHWTVT